MGNLLKDIYSKEFYNNFSDILGEVVPTFDKKKFLKLIFTEGWNEKELKQRMRHTTIALGEVLPQNFQQSAIFIEKIIRILNEKYINEKSLEFMFLPDYIEIFGIDDYLTSVKLIENVTQFSSCEFSVRPFIIKYGDKMLQQMLEWSLHENQHVRRLASEGSRPRLPWAIALPELKKNPAPILPILENLKNDPSEYVRRSVANNLNDISKDNPEIVISIAQKWQGQNKETNAILKHASRTLLKQGNTVILEHFGLANNSKIITSKFGILTPIVNIGDNLEFSFSIQNTDKEPLKVRIEYGIYYLLNNGQHSKKVFKISERQLNPVEKIEINRKHSFKIITTKKFYAGQHKLSLIINGQEKIIEKFELLNQ